MHQTLKPFALGPRVGLDPQRHNFAVGIPTCWYLKTLKFALPPTPTPNASQWNIGCVGSPGVGSPGVGAHVGHVHFMLSVSISFTLGSQRKRGFHWNMGFIAMEIRSIWDIIIMGELPAKKMENKWDVKHEIKKIMPQL